MKNLTKGTFSKNKFLAGILAVIFSATTLIWAIGIGKDP